MSILKRRCASIYHSHGAILFLSLIALGAARASGVTALAFFNIALLPDSACTIQLNATHPPKYQKPTH